MKNRRMLLQVLLSMALVLSLIVPTWVAGADEDCYAEKAPELIAPSDGYVIAADCCECVNVPFVIEWDRLCDASRYDIQFALDEDFDSIVEGASDTDYLPPETETPSYWVPAGTLSSETTYYWRVRAVEAETGQVIQSLWSEPRSFTVAPGAEAGAINLVSPEQGATDVALDNLGFSWSLLASADEFDWVLSDNADLSSPVEEKTGLTSTAYECTKTLKNDTSYYWQVTAYKEGSAISKSAIGTFRTMAWGLCSLTVSSTAGGSVTTPGEEIYTYELGEVINLVAEPEDGYRFVRWTGDVSTIGNVNAASTNITMQDNFLITANFAIPPIQYYLTTASTAGGSVTTPGEGTSSYDEGTVVNLVAEPEEGYRFVGWIGDVDAIANIDAASTTISTDGDYSVKANFVANFVGVRTGDWMRLEYTITGWSGLDYLPYPEWLELEFISVEGTSASVEEKIGMSDGTELSATVPVDLTTGSGEAFELAGFVIPSNLRRGDSVYITGYGDVTIEGETTRTYAGARRRVVYASISQSVPYQGEIKLAYYWDKLTGVVVEASATAGGMTVTGNVTETNMWEAGTPAGGMKWWLWVIIAVAIAGVAFAVYRLRRKKMPTAPTPPPEGS